MWPLVPSSPTSSEPIPHDIGGWKTANTDNPERSIKQSTSSVLKHLSIRASEMAQCLITLRLTVGPTSYGGSSINTGKALTRIQSASMFLRITTSTSSTSSQQARFANTDVQLTKPLSCQTSSLKLYKYKSFPRQVGNNTSGNQPATNDPAMTATNTALSNQNTCQHQTPSSSSAAGTAKSLPSLAKLANKEHRHKQWTSNATSSYPTTKS